MTHFTFFAAWNRKGGEILLIRICRYSLSNASSNSVGYIRMLKNPREGKKYMSGP